MRHMGDVHHAHRCYTGQIICGYWVPVSGRAMARRIGKKTAAFIRMQMEGGPTLNAVKLPGIIRSTMATWRIGYRCFDSLTSCQKCSTGIEVEITNQC